MWVLMFVVGNKYVNFATWSHLIAVSSQMYLIAGLAKRKIEAQVG